MTTIESINKKIVDKITLVKLAFEQVQCLCKMLDDDKIKYLDALGSHYVNLYALDFDQLESEYSLSVIRVLTDYYGGTKISPDTEEKFYKIITSDNFVSRIDEYIGKLRAIIGILIIEINRSTMVIKSVTSKKTITDLTVPLIAINCTHVVNAGSALGLTVDKIKRNIDSAANITVHIEHKKVAYDMCICGHRMHVNPAQSELVCTNSECSAVRKLEGTAAEDMETGDISGNKQKHADYSPNRHFKFWIERIQAKEKKSFTDDETGNIKRVIRRDGYDIMTVYIMRDILKELKMTSYNDHAALLMKLVTGVSPPALSSDSLQKVSMKFSKIIDILETIKDPDGNRPYYPYFIFKVLEDEALISHAYGNILLCKQYRRLMGYIHLQSDDTVRKNDMLFKQICDIAAKQDRETNDAECVLTFRTT